MPIEENGMFKRLLAACALLMFNPLVIAHGAPGNGSVLELNPPLYAPASGKIEVVEYFWYGCGTCYALEPHIEAWLEKLPKDVEFKRTPAPGAASWTVPARTYFALEALGLQPKLHRPFFDAIQKERLRPTNTQQLDDWLSRQGVDVARFHAAENSFTVESKLKRADQLFNRVNELSHGVPAVVVNGRYIISASQFQVAEMPGVINTVIEQVRKDSAKK